MGPIPSWLDPWMIRQDYLWFVVAAGWGVLLTLSRPVRLPGMVALSLGAAAQAAGEVVGMLILADSSGRPAFEAEAALGLLGCAPAVLLYWAGTTRRFGRLPGVAGLLMLWALLLTASALRPAHPLAAVAVLNGLAILAGWAGVVWHRSGEMDPRPPSWWPRVLTLAVLAVGFSSGGVVAEWAGWPRRSLNVSPMGLVAVCLQLALLAAGAATVGTVIRRRDSAEPILSNLRQFAAFFLVWIATGALLVELAGHHARQDFIEGLRIRLRTCLGTFDPAALERSLGPDFRLVRIRESRAPPWVVLVADAPATLQPGFLPHQRRLEILREENPDVSWIMISTLRQGWLVNAGLPFTSKRRRNGVISVERAATAEDHEAWASRQGYVEGPAWSPRGTFLTVAEPIIAPAGRMLGWLAVKVDARRLFVAQSPARMLTSVTVGLGCLVAAGFIALRVRGQAQRAARAQAEAAQAANRMKSALLMHVSHELRTPLQGILGYAELLARHPLGAEQRGWLQAQQRQGQLLLRLVNDLIDLGSLQSGVLSLAVRPGQIVSLVEETVLGLRPRAHLRDLKLEFEADQDVPAWLEFDPDRVRQIVLNLVGNAIKFTERGGVAVSVRWRKEAGELACLEIGVADTGPGIDPAQQHRLFQPFARLETARPVEGAGLGLAMAYGLCKAMGGSLTVESDGFSGSIFRACLRLPPAAHPTGDRSGVVEPAWLNGCRIVIADDNALVRELYLTHLTALGAVCTGVTDGREALTAVQVEPTPHLLLLDLSMPQVGGLEVSQQLRAAGLVDLRIVGISAHGSPEHRKRALAAGMDDFLVKPVALDDLGRCLQRHLRTARAPVSKSLPAAVRSRLRETFERETPLVLQDMARALSAGDWAGLETRAHYLKSSAWVMEKQALADGCQALGRAAQAADRAGATALLAEVNRLVRT